MGFWFAYRWNRQRHLRRRSLLNAWRWWRDWRWARAGRLEERRPTITWDDLTITLDATGRYVLGRSDRAER